MTIYDDRKDQKESFKSWLIKALFPLGVVYIVAAPILFLFSENAKEPAIFVLISGALLAIFSRFDDVSELGLFGLKAKIERVLNDAYATLEQVKKFAKIISISSLSNTARSGWMGGMPEDQKREILVSTLEGLDQLGCDELEIRQISEDFHDCQLLEYRQVLLGGGGCQTPDTKDEQLRKEWNDLIDKPVNPPISPNELNTFFEKFNLMTQENRMHLEGYKYYFENHEFQNFDDFKNREKWPRLKSIEN